MYVLVFYGENWLIQFLSHRDKLKMASMISNIHPHPWVEKTVISNPWSLVIILYRIAISILIIDCLFFAALTKPATVLQAGLGRGPGGKRLNAAWEDSQPKIKTLCLTACQELDAASRHRSQEVDPSTTLPGKARQHAHFSRAFTWKHLPCFQSSAESY